jgi:plasmid stabilization system protein ParE
MTRRIITARFRSDTNYILDYLDRVASPRVAEKYASRFRTTIDRLIRFPRSGAPRPLLGVTTRAARVSPYLLLYDYNLEDDAVVLLRVLHESRNITAELIRGK